MKKLLLYTIIILTPVLSFADTIPIPELKSPVTDLAGTLSENEINLLEQKLLSFESDSTAQIAVLIISTTGEETIEEFSMRLAEQWKIGYKGTENGIIILVAKDDRTIRIEVAYGMEQYITDSDASDIINYEITPEFKSGDFYSGINSGIDKLIFLINNESNIYDYNSISQTYSEDTEYSGDTEYSEEFAVNNKKIMCVILLMLLNFVSILLTNIKVRSFIIYILVLITLAIILGLIFNDTEFIWYGILITVSISFIPLLINIFNGPPEKFSSISYGTSKTYPSKSSSSGWKSYSSSSSSSSSWGSSSGSSYSGGGGSFGGGGASGSW